jgi:DNA repair exonuclease SbcCD nuclease subunit
MRRPLEELKGVLASVHTIEEIPILCAGDIFDSWKANNELVNWAIDQLPTMYSIPGQHDEPYHQQSEMYKSAYTTLIKARTIKDITTFPLVNTNLYCKGVPWGVEIEIPAKGNIFKILLAHQYVWRSGCSYPGAPEEGHIGKLKDILSHYNVAIFGDNHKGFICECGDCHVINCGCLFRRKTDEIDYKPMVGLIYNDGHIEPYYLDTSKDQIEAGESVQKKETDLELADFLKGLQLLQESKLDFKEALEQAMNNRKVNSAVRAILSRAMETSK